eukprot:scaffold603_cov404-Prasinococcus_capsulatus_cf.AAC.56
MCLHRRTGISDPSSAGLALPAPLGQLLELADEDHHAHLAGTCVVPGTTVTLISQSITMFSTHDSSAAKADELTCMQAHTVHHTRSAMRSRMSAARLTASFCTIAACGWSTQCQDATGVGSRHS